MTINAPVSLGDDETVTYLQAVPLHTDKKGVQVFVELFEFQHDCCVLPLELQRQGIAVRALFAASKECVNQTEKR